MKFYSFNMQDNQNVTYLGKDLSQLLDEKLEESRPVLKEVELKKIENKIKILLTLNSFDYHTIEINLEIVSYDHVLLSMDIGEKSVRIDNRLKRFDVPSLDRYFSNMDKALASVSKLESVKSGARLEANDLFVKLLDSINRLLLF